MFTKILIANRGEIARRINTTARKMGIATVGVYSDADAKSLHVKECSEAVHLGPSTASESYLNIPKLIEAAKRTGAQAIHPGYGFLSENPSFAQACEDAGIVFIGPDVNAITVMGSKSEAKVCVQRAGVPLIEGYFGADQSLETLQREAQRIGFPLMIKAVAGGGGKGIRIVNEPSELPAALESCQREARNAFADASVMLEKRIVQPRHIEVQVFADTHGNVVHLFERDCSAQRRHQKVIEEAPAYGLSDALRQKIGETAVDVARAVNYRGAGTVEFLLDASGEFYFMEMNTRLQVEHPVTEMITGFDLVRWQIEIAAGLPLVVQQQDIQFKGHAFEARLYAENPDAGFLPAIGEVALWQAEPEVQFESGFSPAFERHAALAPEGLVVRTRLDAAMASGLHISPFYDPMVGKLIVWGKDRATALNQLVLELEKLRCIGVKNNIRWLRKLCLNESFQQGGYDTGLIDRMSEQTQSDHSDSIDAKTLAAMVGLARWVLDHVVSDDTIDPFAMRDGFSSTLPLLRQDQFSTEHGGSITVHSHVRALSNGTMNVTGFFKGEISGELNCSFSPSAAHEPKRLRGLIDGQSADLIWQGNTVHVFVGHEATTLAWHNPADIRADQVDAGHGVAAPMPGKIFAVHVKAGDSVKKGQPLIGLEAMKMEHTLYAPRDAVVQAVPHALGEQVTEGTELIHFED